MKRVKQIVMMAFASLLAQCVWAATGVISINFNSNQGDGAADSGMVHVPAEAWMNVTGTSNTRAGNSMNYYNGSEVVAGPSTMSITWDGSSNYQYTDGITDNVLKGYLDDGKNTAITITGLPFKKYNVYLICSTDTENAKFRHWNVNGVDYIGSAEGATAGTGNWGTSRAATCALGTNVIKVADQTGALSIVGAGKSGSNRGTIAAIQVEEVEVPAAPEANFVFDGASKSITRPEGETGWWSSWGGEGLNADTSALSPNGFVGAVAEGRHPWTGSTVPSEFTLSLYTDPSLVSGDTKKLFWAIGDGLTSNIITLARDGDNLVFSAVGGSVSTPVPGVGYHLVTVTFSTSAISIAIDGQTPVKATGTYNAVTTGFQVGSAYRGIPSGFAKPIGLPIAKLMGFSKVLTDAEIAALAIDYPAETIIAGARTFTGANLYIGSMKHINGRLEVNRGKLNVPAGLTYSVPALRFGNDGGNGSGEAFGLELDGTLIISGGQTTDGNGQNGVRADVVNNRGGILGGEWTGQGVYNIRGTLDARNSFVQLVHDASAQTWNVANGGVFRVKAFEARPSQGKAESTHIINIAEGGQVISTQGFTRGALTANVEEGGVLEVAATANTSMQPSDLSKITGNGQIKFSGTNWISLPSGEGKMFASTLEVVNNSTGNGGGLLFDKAVTYTIGPMSGNGEIRFDANDTGARTLKIIQSKNTEWTGNIKSMGSSTRSLNIQITSDNDSIFKRTGQCADTTSHFTVDAGATLQLETNANGVGNTVILNGGKLTTTGVGNAHGKIVRNLTLTNDSAFESSSNIFGIGHDNNESTLSLNGYTLTATAPNESTRFYLDKVSIQTAGTLNVTKGKLFIHCASITAPENTKIVIGENASIEADAVTLSVPELVYNGTATTTAGDMCVVTVTSKFSGTGSIPKLTLGDGAEVSGSATVTTTATANGTVKLMSGTLSVPTAFAANTVKSGVATKRVVTTTVEGGTKYSLETIQPEPPTPTEDGITPSIPGADTIEIVDAEGTTVEGDSIPLVTGVYTVTGKVGETVVGTQEIGVVNAKAAETTTDRVTTAVAVPFKGKTVATLLNTALLDEGDTLMAWVTVGEKSGYATWKLTSGAWVGENVVNGIAAQPATTALKCGQAVWVTTAGQIVTFGDTAAQGAEVEVTTGHNLLGSIAYTEAVPQTAAENDQVQLIGEVDAEGNEVITRYNKTSTDWVSKIQKRIDVGNGVSYVKEETSNEAPTVKPGRGYWLIRK